jgi:hypothetical protein
MMEFGFRRHHLLEEAKAELDIAYEEVKRAEQEIMAYEAEYNEKSKALNGAEDALRALMAEKEAHQEKFGIAELYDLQRSAIQRFAQISAVFTIVHSVESESVATDLIGQLLFRTKDDPSKRVEFNKAIRRFAINLRTYSLEESSIENDYKVRESWNVIEKLLQDVGRPNSKPVGG